SKGDMPVTMNLGLLHGRRVLKPDRDVPNSEAKGTITLCLYSNQRKEAFHM
ncbi:hypothetical protein CEXT_582021, partial [Caerostris extrusa]